MPRARASFAGPGLGAARGVGALDPALGHRRVNIVSTVRARARSQRDSEDSNEEEDSGEEEEQGEQETAMPLITCKYERVVAAHTLL